MARAIESEQREQYKRIFFGYGRVSKLSQIKDDDSDSIASQEKAVYQEFERMLASGNYGDLQWGGFFKDPGKSASSLKLFQRPEGQKLLSRLQPGDIICAAAFDRIFRNSTDALFTKEKTDAKGVKIVLLDFFGVDTSSDIGMLLFDFYAAIKAFEGRENARRTRAVRTLLKEKGKVYTAHPPYGYQMVKSFNKVTGKVKSYLGKAEDSRKLFRLCYWLYVHECWSYPMIARFLNYLGFKNRVGGPYTHKSVQQALYAAHNDFPPRCGLKAGNAPANPDDRIERRPLQPVCLDYVEEYDGTRRACLSYLGSEFLRAHGLYEQLSAAGLLGGWTQAARAATQPHPTHNSADPPPA